ncbi:unnamed protein product, partial [Polarella glacialis]
EPAEMRGSHNNNFRVNNFMSGNPSQEQDQQMQMAQFGQFQYGQSQTHLQPGCSSLPQTPPEQPEAPEFVAAWRAGRSRRGAAPSPSRPSLGGSSTPRASASLKEQQTGEDSTAAGTNGTGTAGEGSSCGNLSSSQNSGGSNGGRRVTVAEARSRTSVPWKRNLSESSGDGCGPGSSGNGSGDGSGDGSGSSWDSGTSSLTAVPRSEHTGTGSPPATSESSSCHAGGSGDMMAGGGGFTTDGSGKGAPAFLAPGSCTGAKLSRSERFGGATPQVTTLQINNVPTYLTQGALLSMFEDLTFSMRGKFDFFYCPWDERAGQNLGYALINFSDANYVQEFQQMWANKELCKGGRGHKALRVTKAALQGLQANLNYFQKVELGCLSTDNRFRPLYRGENGTFLPLGLDADASVSGVGADSAGVECPEAKLPESATQETSHGKVAPRT